MLSIAIAFLSLATETEAANKPPRDLWVFRSVLDQRARIATLALAQDFWLAYDATNCGLYKFWKGDVKFNGAVYTTEHGPNPTSEGGAIQNGVVDKDVWFMEQGGQRTFAKHKYRGHFFDPKNRNKVSFQYELNFGKESFTVVETPTMLWENRKPVGLLRTFALTSNASKLVSYKPAGFKVGIVVDNGGTATLKSTGGSIASVSGLGRAFTIDGNVGSVSCLFDPVLSNPRQQVSETSDEVFASIETAPQGGGNKSKDDVREPGLSFRAYQLEGKLDRVPKLVPNQSPSVSRKIDTVGFYSGEDFGIQNVFFASVNGWLKIPKPGLYQFRLTSDDGAKLFLKEEKIIDNDGVHTQESKTGSMELDQASHPIRVEYFNTGPEALLTLEWKQPGSNSWEEVPAEQFETLSGEVHVVAPGLKKIMDSLWPMRAGDGRPEETVHPSFDLSTPRPDDFTPRVGGIDFLPNGDLILCTWDPEGAVYQMSGVQSGDPKKVKVKKIAKGLAEPLGITYSKGSIYVLQKQELTKLVDSDGDGVTDEYYAVANNWGVTENFHEFAFGLVNTGGYFYGTLALAINPGGRSTGFQDYARGRVVKINEKTGDFEYVASGLRTPNGICLNKGDIFLTDNQGDWIPSCKLLQFTPGAFYGNRSVEFEKLKGTKEAPPVCWFPQGEIGNSISQPAPFEYGPYKGQMIAGDVTHGGLKRISLEKVNGRYQGTAFRMTQGLEAGINRVRIGPDKAIYVGGIGSTGNWGQEGKERFGLQRLAYNGKSTFEMLTVKPAKNGAEIVLTEPLAEEQFPLALDSFWVEQWHYEPTIDYGGPKIGPKRLPVKAITMSKDRKRLFLEFDGIKPEHVVYIKLPSELQSATGKLMWSTEAWSTVNVIPNRVGKLDMVATKPSAFSLSEAEKAVGFRSLFDGTNMDQFRGYRRTDMPKGWVVTDGTLTYVPGVAGGGGDLLTKEQFNDFELRLDWKIQEGGNSGIIYRVQETKGATYETGAEMQVLDDAKHNDGKSPLTSAGSAYALYPPAKKVALPATHWNQARLVAKGDTFQHWLNGVLIVEYDRKSPDFKERLKKSKFNGWDEFATKMVGHIAFQDHGDLVSYRNIRIKKL